MRCPDELELALWIDGHLPPERVTAMQQHLEECLECRIAAGTLMDDVESDDPDSEARSAIPPFQEIEPALRAAYRGGLTAPGFGGLLEEDLPILMAADTGNLSDSPMIPSLYGEEGRLVVAFRTDGAGQVTAFFVSEDDARVRFRALQVGEQIFLGDVDGRVILSGLTAEEVIGKQISILPLLATAAIRFRDLPTGADSPVTFEPMVANLPPARISARAGSEGAAMKLLLFATGLPRTHCALIVAWGGAPARLLHIAEGEETVLSWDGEEPETAQILLVERF